MLLIFITVSKNNFLTLTLPSDFTSHASQGILQSAIRSRFDSTDRGAVRAEEGVGGGQILGVVAAALDVGLVHLLLQIGDQLIAETVLGDLPAQRQRGGASRPVLSWQGTWRSHQARHCNHCLYQLRCSKKNKMLSL